MKKTDLSLFTMLFSSVLSGCSPSVKNCNTPEILDLVTQRVSAEMIKQVGEEKEKKFTYEVKAVTINDTDEKSGVYECSAELIINEGVNSNAKPVMFTVSSAETAPLVIDIVGFK